MTYLINSNQTISAARRRVESGQLELHGVAIITFQKAVIERLETLCNLEEVEWISPFHHPYAAAHIVKQGRFQGTELTVLVPPMGGSPMACIIEDLAACGIKAVILICAAWSLGPPVQFGDLIIPEFSVGMDGTSIHYPRDPESVSANPSVVRALVKAGKGCGAKVRVGGNGSCEALYRITPQMAKEFRDLGCLTMDNGEVNTVFAVTDTLEIHGAVLFQPYIELLKGWDPSILRTKRYRETCWVQAEVAVNAAVELRDQGLFER